MFNILSIFIGSLIALMTSFNGLLSTYTGNYLSSIIIHLVGLIAVTCIIFIKKSKLTFERSLPLYLYSAGIIGVFTVLFNNFTFIPLGATLTMALGLFGQTISSIIIDHFGLLGTKISKFNYQKFIGLGFIVLGLIIMVIY